MGPNEARMVYDAGVSSMAAVASGLLCLLFVKRALLPARDVIAICCLPLLLLAFNALFGIYSSLKTAQARQKALALLAATICACGAAWAIAADPAPIVLWATISYPPIAVARVLLSLPTAGTRS